MIFLSTLPVPPITTTGWHLVYCSGSVWSRTDLQLTCWFLFLLLLLGALGPPATVWCCSLCCPDDQTGVLIFIRITAPFASPWLTSRVHLFCHQEAARPHLPQHSTDDVDPVFFSPTDEIFSQPSGHRVKIRALTTLLSNHHNIYQTWMEHDGKNLGDSLLNDTESCMWK